MLQSPRQVLKRQVDRLAEYGWTAFVGTELEFIVFNDTYEQAWERRYVGLTHANQYNVDYSILGTARVEPLLRAIRLGMRDAGLRVESAKGECNLGQHEIAFQYTDALTTCDNHVVYKNGAKEIAAQHGSALTFMAKYDEREGNSCHIHLSLRSPDGDPVFAGDRDGGVSKLFEHFLAGQLAALRELTYLFAPNINSYKRYQPGSFAPTAVKWGHDNRTCALRVIGHGASLRFENRVPGGDVNPYLAVAGHDRGRVCTASRTNCRSRTPFAGNAYESRCRARCRPRSPRRRASGRAARSPAPPSATRSSTTTRTPPGSSSPHSTPRSPTGSGSADSSGCEQPPVPSCSTPAASLPADGRTTRGQGPEGRVTDDHA